MFHLGGSKCLCFAKPGSGCIFFVLEQAYDTTWPAGILKQLSDRDIGGKMFLCVKDFLSDRYLKAGVSSYFSSEYLQEEGIPQGSVMKPTPLT